MRIAVAGLLVRSAGNATAADLLCADLTAMDSGAKSLRLSLNYVEMFADTTQACSRCAFFQASTDGCGSCQIFNGPANSKGHCDSWSAKG